MTVSFAKDFFDETYYLQHNPDVLAAIVRGEFASAYDHFLAYGQFENRAPNALFNPTQYLIDNPDVLSAVGNHSIPSAWDHFVNYGMQEGRACGSFDFDEQAYLKANPDVAAAVANGDFVSGYEHFLLYGEAECRSNGTFTGTFDEQAYLQANPDVAAAVASGDFVNGYEHYLLYGEAEGRAAHNTDGEPINTVPGNAFTLTTDFDTLTGTVEDDVFNAPLAKVYNLLTVPTLDSEDKVDGREGNDVANLTLLNQDVAFNSKSVETVNVRSLEGSVFGGMNAKDVGNRLHIASDVTTLTEANSNAGLVVTGAAGVTSITSGGEVYLAVEGLEASAITLNVAKAENTVVLEAETETNKAALSELTVNFAGGLDLEASNTVTKLTVNANGNGSFDDETNDSLSFVGSSKLATITVAGKGDLQLDLDVPTLLPGTLPKLTSFDASGLAGGVQTVLVGDGADSVLATIKGGTGDNDLTVGNLKDGGTVVVAAGDDVLTLTALGGYTVEAGDGNDSISANVVASKTTVINGGAGDDAVSLVGLVGPAGDYTDSKLTVDLGDGNDSLSATVVVGKTTVINGGAGDDAVSLVGLVGPADIYADSKLTVDLGAGNDSLSATVVVGKTSVINGGAGDDAVSLVGLVDPAGVYADSKLTVDLGAGDDKLTLIAPSGYTVEAGDGDDIVTANVVAGQTTVINGGAGDDVVSLSGLDGVYADSKSKLTVDLGAGDDFVNADNLAAAQPGVTFAGGAGKDTIRVTGDFGLLAAKKISGFEVIDLSGNQHGMVDMSRETELDSIVIHQTATLVGATAYDVTAGTDISVSGSGNNYAGVLTYILDDSTGSADSVAVTLTAEDGNDNGIADGGVGFSLTAPHIETVNVVSTANVDADDASTEETDESTTADEYVNVLNLTGDFKTITVSGDAGLTLVLSNLPFASSVPSLKTIDATENTGGVSVNLWNTGVTFKGGAGDDVIVSEKGGAVIDGGAGSDVYVLDTPFQHVDDPATPLVNEALHDVKDTVVFSEASDSRLGVKVDAETGDVSIDFSQIDHIVDFGSEDLIDLKAFGFSGTEADGIIQKTVATEADALKLLQDGGADFYKEALVYKGIVEVSCEGYTGLVIDADKDGNFSAAHDLIIDVTKANHTFEVSDFIFAA